MKIFFLTQPLYTSISTAIKKIEDADTAFFNGKDADISIDVYYLHPSDNPSKITEQENFFLHDIEKYRPDLFLYQPARQYLTDKVLQKIRALHIPIASMFADTFLVTPEYQFNVIKNSDYTILLDSVTNYLSYQFLYETSRTNDRGAAIFAPGNHFPTEVFRPLFLEKEYDAAIIGSLEGMRHDMAMFLAKALTQRGLSFYCGGGIINFDGKNSPDAASATFLPVEEYVQVINKTKVNIVTQTEPTRRQIKGKVFEYMSCGAFCLIDKNIEYELLLPEGVVAYYSSPAECLEKIIYYNQHEKAREVIAKKGQQWYLENFNYKKFWKDCFVAMINRAETLPNQNQITKIYRKLQKKLAVNQTFLAELHTKIDAALGNQDSIIMPLNVLASTQTTTLKNPLAAGNWEAHDVWPQWLVFDYGRPVTLNVMRISQDTNTIAPLKKFTIQASNDMQNWSTLYASELAREHMTQTVHFNNLIAYKFYRLNGYSNYYGSHTMTLQNVEFLASDNTDYTTPVTINIAELDFFARTFCMTKAKLWRVGKKAYHRLPKKIKPVVKQMALRCNKLLRFIPR